MPLGRTSVQPPTGLHFPKVQLGDHHKARRFCDLADLPEGGAGAHLPLLACHWGWIAADHQLIGDQLGELLRSLADLPRRSEARQRALPLGVHLREYRVDVGADFQAVPRCLQFLLLSRCCERLSGQIYSEY